MRRASQLLTLSSALLGVEEGGGVGSSCREGEERGPHRQKLAGTDSVVNPKGAPS